MHCARFRLFKRRVAPAIPLRTTADEAASGVAAARPLINRLTAQLQGLRALSWRLVA